MRNDKVAGVVQIEGSFILYTSIVSQALVGRQWLAEQIYPNPGGHNPTQCPQN